MSALMQSFCSYISYLSLVMVSLIMFSVAF
nr:MAG TPA: hypothetical protein [Caudoviricetes sp.]